MSEMRLVPLGRYKLAWWSAGSRIYELRSLLTIALFGADVHLLGQRISR